MLDLIDAGDDVIAVKVAGKITGADLDSIMTRLEDVMRRHETVYVFVETDAIEGIEISAFPSYAARAMPLFGKLGRFGRVAVVADQAWIRMATRAESAILPFISYRVFEPAQRVEALAWVAGTA